MRVMLTYDVLDLLDRERPKVIRRQVGQLLNPQEEGGLAEPRPLLLAEEPQVVQNSPRTV
jgi:hypothetical protein